MELKNNQGLGMIEAKALEILKTGLFILGPVLILPYIFFLNVTTIQVPQKKIEQKANVTAYTRGIEELQNKVWYRDLMPKRHSRTIAMKK